MKPIHETSLAAESRSSNAAPQVDPNLFQELLRRVPFGGLETNAEFKASILNEARRLERRLEHLRNTAQLDYLKARCVLMEIYDYYGEYLPFNQSSERLERQ